jgi:hypothetical protein
MFDHMKLRAWLRDKTTELQSAEITTSLRHGPDDGPKPGMAFNIVGRNALGSFENWITGETDWTILAPTDTTAKLVSNKWMLTLTDETFEDAFLEFIAEFRKHNAASTT